MMSYFKKHFVTQVRNFVFAYRKSIERKCPMTNKGLYITFFCNTGGKNIPIYITQR